MGNSLIVKNISFNGDELIACNDNGTIYVGISLVCKSLGFDKSQKDSQIQKIQHDIVLNRGCLKFKAGVFDEHNESLGLNIEYLPIWLAKINTNIISDDYVQNKLIEYQLKAKDVLADAFLNKFVVPKTFKEALLLAVQQQEEIERLEFENSEKQVLIEKQKPMVDFAEHVSNSCDSIEIGLFSKIIQDENINIGRNKLFEWLRDNGYLMKNNEPYQKYITDGYFTVIETSFKTPYGTKIGSKTLVTGIGQIKLLERLKKEFRVLTKN